MTDFKLWYFGRLIKNKHAKYSKLKWAELLEEEELILFIHTHSLSAHQIKCIKLGFENRPITSLDEQPGKFPFGVHKGKRFEDLPERYIVWCSKQPWIDKWPTVKDYIARFFKDRDGGMTKEEMIAFLNENKS